MMFHPARVSTLQSNLCTCTWGHVFNHSGLMCLLSYLLRLFNCTILMWWNVTPCGPLCGGGLCFVIYTCGGHVPTVACAFSSWTFASFCFLFMFLALLTSFSSFFNLQLPLKCTFFLHL